MWEIEMGIKHIYRNKNFYKLLLIVGVIMMGASTQAAALEYKACNNDNSPLSCTIALAKLRTLKSPFKNHKLFDNGLHYVDGELFSYPNIYVAEGDLDGDGYNEMVVKILEQDGLMAGHYCKNVDQCLHYILQDRNSSSGRTKLSKIRAMGPFLTYSIGLSTDEIVGGYKSLRVYQDQSWKKFDVYQYDRKTDNYYNISASK